MKRLKLEVLKEGKFKAAALQLTLWVLLITTLLLFMPKSLLALLHLESWVDTNAHYIGLTLLLALAYIGALAVNLLLDEAISRLSERRINEMIEAKVRLLDPAERALLREFFLQGASVLTLPQNEAPVQALLKAHILESLGNERHYAIQGPTAEYKIAMAARKHLNRRVLRLPPGEPSQEELQYLIKARPQFINAIAQVRKHAA
ncbi:superinfection exclusion B family protein [Shewanella indica]|uniref:superinfection exclusion B family protein n=1 Tax=Shewanella indica TaxID=768528 RepID=UPI000C33045B|nr:superinfection exclusion B family protein [Shewanella indica]GHA92578.1 hypothetical protein GCM10007107_01730 [Shewanella indica]